MTRTFPPANRSARRPSGQPTRGKTAENRLRQVDVYVGLALPSILRGGQPLVVDLGFGAQPWTTLEMATRLSHVNEDMRTLGVEIDPERVAQATAFADPPRIGFARGGFDLASVTGPGTVRMVRAYNVLRQYGERDVAAALSQIAEALEPGGLLLEGTSTPSGAMVAFDVWHKPANSPTGASAAAKGVQTTLERETGLAHAALVFGTNFREPHEPADFQTILPKRLIHRMLDERPSRFFADWSHAAEVARATAAHAGRREQWAQTAEAMRQRYGWPVDRRRRLLTRGFMAVGTELS